MDSVKKTYKKNWKGETQQNNYLEPKRHAAACSINSSYAMKKFWNISLVFGLDWQYLWLKTEVRLGLGLGSGFGFGIRLVFVLKNNDDTTST